MALEETKAATESMRDAGLSQLVQAMATYSTGDRGYAGSAVMPVPHDLSVQNVIAASWHP
jgi:hypothetical protein